MKKPLNRWAILFWVAAAIVVVGQIASLAFGKDSLGYATLFNKSMLWMSFKYLVAAMAPVVGFGIVIELIDQIRWNALHRSD